MQIGYARIRTGLSTGGNQTSESQGKKSASPDPVHPGIKATLYKAAIAGTN